MEMKSKAEGSTKPSDFKSFCIREYVAEVRKRDWKKCCPFNLSGDYEESNFGAYMILAPLLQEDNNALVNTPEDTEAPNFFTASEVRNSKVQEAGSETLTGITCQDTVIGDDAANTINDGPSESAPRRVKDARCQNEKIVTEDVMAVESDKTQDSVSYDDSANSINDRPSETNRSKSNNAKCQNEKRFANDAVAVEIDKPQHTVIDDDAVKTFSDGPSKSASNKMKDDAQSKNEKNISADALASENDKPKHRVFNHDADNTINEGPSSSAAIEVRDGRCQNVQNIAEDAMADENGRRQRNLVRRKPQKFRLLSAIYKELAGHVDSEFSTETEDKSDSVTLDTFIREKKCVRVTSKSSGELKNKRKTPQVVEPKLDQAKRSKSVSEDIHGSDSKHGSKYHLRTNGFDKLDLQMTKKRKNFSAEIRHSSTQIMHENQGAPSSLGGQENTSGTRKDLLSCGHKSNREVVQEDCAREADLKLLDGNQRHFTEEENHSRPAHGVESAQLVQPTTTISNNDIETTSGCVHKRIRESSPPYDNESMAALQLLRLSNAGVNSKTSSKTETENPALSVAKHKNSCGLDGVVLHASKSMASKPLVEINMINGAGLPQAEQTKSGISMCLMNQNPAEFSIPDAKKFMRHGKIVEAV